DAVGAAVGVAFIAQEQGRPAYVAINAEATLAAPLVKRLQKECPDLLMTPEEAVEACDDHTVVVIVDTVNKELVESKELYQKAKQVVVIDHHRKMANCIDDMLLLLHDPLASSAAELVTEMLAYLELHKDLPGLYAESLLAGIMLDTKNFVMQTGVHTFEAAALLRECGADPIVVKTLFSATMSAYRQRSRMVVDAELHGRCAIPLQEMNVRISRSLPPRQPMSCWASKVWTPLL
ncbi:MAG: DHH family phosphoesterase, partial [Oscillospiraceae bacterium]|nr:DHH family phosphoesterase [Oscillospiraceae bacterium]